MDFEIFPRAGYSDNNTIVWIDKYNLLCRNLVKVWSQFLVNSKVSRAGGLIDQHLSRYDSIEIVVPGRGLWGDSSLIDYTLGLFEE